MSDTAGLPGQIGLTDNTSPFNQQSFHVEQQLGRIRTIVLATVKKVKLPGGNGAVAAAGSIDVQPITNQVDGQGNSVPHGTVFNLKYTRSQGGSNAVIMDPQVGDIVVVGVADRDISANIKANGQANPGSRRRFSLSDGIILGTVLAKNPPTQYIRFTDTGIEMGDKNGNKVTLGPTGVTVTTASLMVNGSVIAGFGTGDQVGLQTHTHAHGPAPDPGS